MRIRVPTLWVTVRDSLVWLLIGEQLEVPASAQVTHWRANRSGLVPPQLFLFGSAVSVWPTFGLPVTVGRTPLGGVNGR